MADDGWQSLHRCCSCWERALQVTKLHQIAETIRSQCASIVAFKSAGTEEAATLAQQKAEALKVEIAALEQEAAELGKQADKAQATVRDLDVLSRWVQLILASMLIQDQASNSVSFRDSCEPSKPAASAH
jgi:hypothetical protein